MIVVLRSFCSSLLRSLLLSKSRSSADMVFENKEIKLRFGNYSNGSSKDQKSTFSLPFSMESTDITISENFKLFIIDGESLHWIIFRIHPAPPPAPGNGF